MKQHPGFKELVARGVPAGALAKAARNASPAAKKANPRLKRVKGKSKHGFGPHGHPKVWGAA